MTRELVLISAFRPEFAILDAFVAKPFAPQEIEGVLDRFDDHAHAAS